MTYKVAKYYQIKQDILDDIKCGKLKPGDKIDSESMLKKKYNVSTITVRRAFGDLINEGYLYGRQGVGTFVARQRFERGLTSISFSDELLQQGYTIDMKIDAIEAIKDERIAQKLNIDADEIIICLKRIREANGTPVAYHMSYIAEKRLSLQAADEIKVIRSFYQTLNQHHIHVEWARETYSVKPIYDKAVAHQLNLSRNNASFFIERYAYDGTDEIIEYCETYFNPDWYSVTVSIKLDE